jgi:hypothetical protein
MIPFALLVMFEWDSHQDASFLHPVNASTASRNWTRHLALLLP